MPLKPILTESQKEKQVKFKKWYEKNKETYNQKRRNKTLEARLKKQEAENKRIYKLCF